MKSKSNLTEQFIEFKNKDKFEPDDSIFYPGISSQDLKPVLTEKIDLAADDFNQVSLKESPTEEDYLEAISIGLDRFRLIYSDLDTEDRERVAYYFEELMDIVGLESSEGQLNGFIYGL